MNPVFAGLLKLEERLTARGFPPLSPWWHATLEAFYESGKRQLVIRSGRRGGKSSTLCRVAIAEALWGGHKVTPGDIGVVAIVSINRLQAAERIRTIEAILLAMGMRHDKDFRRVGDSVELVGKPIIFQTFSATRGGSVGFTGVCLVCDELALWRNEDTGANPATEILAWLRPTMATQPAAHVFLSSSPFSTLDAHHEAFALGDTAHQSVAYAPTWIANPSISEEATRGLEPDVLEWTRQYKAEPVSAGTCAFFDPSAVDAAVAPSLFLPGVAKPGDIVTAGGDFGFRSDSSALVVVHRTGDTVRVADVLELQPEIGFPLLPSKVVETFAQTLKQHGAEYLMSDGHYRQSIAEYLDEHGLQFAIAPEGQRGIQESYIRTRVLLHSGNLKLPKHDRLIKQMKDVVSKPTAGGGVSISSPRKSGGGHGDLVSALVLACWQREGHTVPEKRIKFGSPEYWARAKSPEYLNAQEEARIDAEDEEFERRKNEETQWWEQEPS